MPPEDKPPPFAELSEADWAAMPVTLDLDIVGSQGRKSRAAGAARQRPRPDGAVHLETTHDGLPPLGIRWPAGPSSGVRVACASSPPRRRCPH